MHFRWWFYVLLRKIVAQKKTRTTEWNWKKFHLSSAFMYFAFTSNTRKSINWSSNDWHIWNVIYGVSNLHLTVSIVYRMRRNEMNNNINSVQFVSSKLASIRTERNSSCSCTIDTIDFGMLNFDFSCYTHARLPCKNMERGVCSIYEQIAEQQSDKIIQFGHSTDANKNLTALINLFSAIRPI